MPLNSRFPDVAEGGMSAIVQQRRNANVFEKSRFDLRINSFRNPIGNIKRTKGVFKAGVLRGRINQVCKPELTHSSQSLHQPHVE